VVGKYIRSQRHLKETSIYVLNAKDEQHLGVLPRKELMKLTFTVLLIINLVFAFQDPNRWWSWGASILMVAMILFNKD
jgi:hypothetical protein